MFSYRLLRDFKHFIRRIPQRLRPPAEVSRDQTARQRRQGFSFVSFTVHTVAFLPSAGTVALRPERPEREYNDVHHNTARQVASEPENDLLMHEAVTRRFETKCA